MEKVNCRIYPGTKLSAGRIIPFVALLAIVILAACMHMPIDKDAPTVDHTPPAPLPHSLKGYELWSWQAEGEWHFTLITGTNRLKTVEEITTGEDVIDPEGWVRISVTGVDALKKTLARLPTGEQIFWVGGWYLFFDRLSLPPQETIAEVQEHCQEAGLILSVTE